jgi:hypothetical protein
MIKGYALLSLPLRFADKVEILLTISSFCGLLFLLRKDISKGIFFFFGIVIPLFALCVGLVLIPPVRLKYIIYTLPLIIALSAFLCSEISSAFARQSVMKHAVTFLVIAGLMPGFVSNYTGKNSLDVREAIEIIEQGYTPGDRIIIFGETMKYYFKKSYPFDIMLGAKNGEAKKWDNVLKNLKDQKQRAWILLDTYRNTPLSPDFEHWLRENASMIWRKYEKRYDYTMMGFELYMINGRQT